METLKTYKVSADFADGAKWPDGRLSYTYRDVLVVARDREDAIELASAKFGAYDPKDTIDVEVVPRRRGVYGEI